MTTKDCWNGFDIFRINPEGLAIDKTKQGI